MEIMDKVKKIMSFLCFLSFCGMIEAQCLIKKDTLAYLSAENPICLIEYTVYNNTADTFFLWIDYRTIRTEDLTTEEGDISSFFYFIRKPACELGIAFKCFDGNINNMERFIPTIGCDFIKKIPPRGTFTILSTEDGLLKENIHFLNQDIVKKFLPLDKLDEYVYAKEYIFTIPQTADNK